MGSLPIELTLSSFTFIKNLSEPTPFSSVSLQATTFSPSPTSTSASTSTPKLVVVKSLQKAWALRFNHQQSPKTELEILRLSRSSTTTTLPIPVLLASFLSPTHFLLVLELAQGGDLASVLDDKIHNGVQEKECRGIEEDVVKRWMGELVLAVEWLHKAGWAHRDLKPSNLLLNSRGKLLLSDFGSAAPITSSLPSHKSRPTTRSTKPPFIARKYAKTLVGTPDYIAPEILKFAESIVDDSVFESGGDAATEEEDGKVAYGPEVDWWSFGVCLFELLVGETPFFHETIEGTYDKIVNCNETLSLSAIPSKTAKDLLTHLLIPSSNRYTTSHELKSHSWFSSLHFSTLASEPALHLPTPFIPPPPPSEPSLNFNQSKSKVFDFSAFFSSPGLSILRPSPPSITTSVTSGDDYWEGMETEFLEKDFGGLLEWRFEEDEEERVKVKGGRLEGLKKTGSNPLFETPLANRTSNSSLNVGSTSHFGKGKGEIGVGGSSSRRRRGSLNPVEAWKSMQEHAWEVGMSVKKHRGKEKKTAEEEEEGELVSGLGDFRLDGLEERQKGVLKSLDGMEDRYKELFKLLEK